ncbi:GguC family protein [Rhodocytophaga aerolata]|uniref:GguC family protein n=1 Tax=Rhodocytophaga aerolata TaxID=455078 RepID=A0ABT8RAG4_9BACT|nr:AraD1 family protein [Rhodocytophaga aerolata]MDO1448984.1 GguC family protein [Rhodocytophaga aerolata]
MRIIQFLNERNESRVGIVENDIIQVLRGINSTYQLFEDLISRELPVEETIQQLVSGHYEKYDQLLAEGKVQLPFDHPDPYHTWITGTGLTHLGSAASRNAMHEKLNALPAQELTDSMKMFQMGKENGKMKDGVPASQPEWFYKGNGLMAVAPGKALVSPPFALDGGEEPEIVGLYIIDKSGNPVRVGFALGNEFSDHQTERMNYLYLAHSKLRPCSYGPELLLGDLPSHITGKSRIIRDKKVLWEKEFLTGEANMSHNLANLEYHHFKYTLFRQPGDVHVHFFGTSVLSFGDNIKTQPGDVFEIEADGFGKPLRNTLSVVQ